MVVALLPWLCHPTRPLPANTEAEVEAAMVLVPVAVMALVVVTAPALVAATAATRAQALLRPCLPTPRHPPTPPASTAPAPRAGTTAVMTTAFNVGFLSMSAPARANPTYGQNVWLSSARPLPCTCLHLRR